MKKTLAAQTAERFVLNAMCIKAVKLDIRDIIKTQDEPAMVPGTAALLRRFVYPFGTDAPMGEALVGGDGGQADVIGCRHVGVCGLLCADFPGTTAKGFGVQRRKGRQRHAQLPLRRSDLFLPGQNAGRDVIEQTKVRGIHKYSGIHSSLFPTRRAEGVSPWMVRIRGPTSPGSL